MPAPFSRRQFLGGATAAALTGPLLGQRLAFAQPDELLAPFLHGVASGDPLADRVIIWTRLTTDGDVPARLNWSVHRDPELTDLVASGSQVTSAARDWTVKVDVTGLEPATTYFYVFEFGGQHSLVGRTKTAPAGPTERLRFGVVSCSSLQHGWFHAYAALAQRHDLDAILHLGDYVYEYGPGQYGDQRDHDPPHEVITLDDYRTRYAQYHLDPDLRLLHQMHPFVTTWDDHEFTDNSWTEGAENHQPDEGPWDVRKAAAARAWDEWLPNRLPDPADPLKIWRSSTWGDLVELIVPDTRIDGRDEEASGVLQMDPTVLFPNSDVQAAERTMISPEQLAFVKDRLSNTPAKWKLLAQQVMMMQWRIENLEFPDDAQDVPVLAEIDGVDYRVNGDAWDGYPAERDRILAHVDDNGINNMVVLTGDIHSSWAADLPRDAGPAGYPLTNESFGVEFVCPSVTSSSFYQTLGYPQESGLSQVIEEASKAGNPHIKYVEGDHHGYVILDIDHDRTVAEFWHAHDIETAAPSPDQAPNEFVTAWQVVCDENRLGGEVAQTADGPAAPVPPAEPPPGLPQVDGEDDEEPMPSTGAAPAVLGLAAMAAAASVRRRAAADRPTSPSGRAAADRPTSPSGRGTHAEPDLDS